MHPILCKISLPYTEKIFAIRSYGVMMWFAFVISIYYAMRQGKREGINSLDILLLGIFIAVSAFVGGRLVYILQNWNLFLKHPLRFIEARAGFVFYGGFFLSFVVSLFYLRILKLSFWRIADLCAPSIALGLAIGRIGCFLAGCCYGKPTDLPWGVVFTNPETLARPLGVLLHPTQLYSSLNALTIFFVLKICEKYKGFQGWIFLLFVLLYSFTRSIIEIFRVNPRIFLSLTEAQLVGIILFILASIIIVWKSTKKYERSHSQAS